MVHGESADGMGQNAHAHLAQKVYGCGYLGRIDAKEQECCH